MKAIVYKEYGSPDVLHIEEVDKPDPKENEILIKVSAVSVNYGDALARNFNKVSNKEFNMPMLLLFPVKLAFGLTKPKNPILGSEFAGTVESVGSGVTRFKTGEEVYGYTGQSMKTYAEYLCIKETSSVGLKPENFNMKEACAIPYGSLMAYNLLQKLGVSESTNMLVIGASGSIGTSAVQLAKDYGAKVTGICGTNRVDYVKELGADEVIDYQITDFRKTTDSYDVIFDVLGRNEFSDIKHLLKPGGIYFSASFKMKKLLQSFVSKQVKIGLAMDKQDDLKVIKKLAEDGKIKSIIDKEFSPEQAAEAHKYYESGERTGNVVITFD